MAIEISDWHDLNNVRNDLTEDYLLVNDLTTSTDGYSEYNSGSGWSSIGGYYNPFTGSFNGDIYSIDSLTIDRPNDVNCGLFGRVSGNLKNISLTNVDINAGSYSGGISGNQTSGLIEHCFVSGNLSLSYQGAGIVGDQGGGTVSSCEFNGTITSDSNEAAGLVGNCQGALKKSSSFGSISGDRRPAGAVGRVYQGTVENCYSGASVSGNGVVGGFCGENQNGSITKSFSYGEVLSGNGFVGFNDGGTISDCYWDTESSTQTSSDGGTGLTTSEMTGASAESNMSGLDFVEHWEITNSYPDFKEFISSLQTTSSSASSISLSWVDHINATDYNIYRSPSPGSTNADYSSVATVSSNTYTDTGLENGREYYYRVSGNIIESIDNPFTNPSFETGDFTGWTTVDNSVSHFWDISSSSDVPDGTYAAVNGYDQNGFNNEMKLYQNVDLTGISSISFTVYGVINNGRCDVEIYIDDTFQENTGTIFDGGPETRTTNSPQNFTGTHKFEFRFVQSGGDNLGTWLFDNITVN